MMGGVDTDVTACHQRIGPLRRGRGGVRISQRRKSPRLELAHRVSGLRCSAGRNALAFAKGTDAGNESALVAQAERGGRSASQTARQQAKGDEKISALRKELNTAMEMAAGSIVSRTRWPNAVEKGGRELKGRAAHLHLEDSSKVFNTELISAMELIAMIDVAETLVNAAVLRKESRGAHTCRDFPNRDDQNYLHHSLAFYEAGGRPRIDKKEVALGHWEPEERKY